MRSVSAAMGDAPYTIVSRRLKSMVEMSGTNTSRAWIIAGTSVTAVMSSSTRTRATSPGTKSAIEYSDAPTDRALIAVIDPAA